MGSLVWSDSSFAVFRNIILLHKDLLCYMDIKKMVLEGVDCIHFNLMFFRPCIIV